MSFVYTRASMIFFSICYVLFQHLLLSTGVCCSNNHFTEIYVGNMFLFIFINEDAPSTMIPKENSKASVGCFAKNLNSFHLASLFIIIPNFIFDYKFKFKLSYFCYNTFMIELNRNDRCWCGVVKN